MPPMDYRGNEGVVRSVNRAMAVSAYAIPCFLALTVGYVTYAVVGYTLMDQIRHKYNEPRLATGLTVAFTIIEALMVASYARGLYVIHTTPGVTPLGSDAARAFYAQLPHSRRHKRINMPFSCSRESCNSSDSEKTETDIESGLINSQPYGSVRRACGAVGTDPRLDPDSPRLEEFYSRDVFECMTDGRPIFCNFCGTWKLDRTHHCSELGRCVRRMDHFCPWVGGIVSETTYKFFLQFTAYTSLLCALIVSICSYALWRRHNLGHGGSDARIIVDLVIAVFFGFFATMMTTMCTQHVFRNLTVVESHKQNRVRYMAVHIRRGAEAVPGKFRVITYPLPIDDNKSGLDGEARVTPPEPSVEPSIDEDDPIQVTRRNRAALRDARDKLAYRTFAIISVPPGMNPWDLGWRRNFMSVMGTNPFDWIIPFRLSPHCNHDSSHSFYALSPAFYDLCTKLDLPPSDDP